MKLQNTIAAMFAALVLGLGLGNSALAQDHPDMASDDVITVNVNEADAALIAKTLVGVGILRAQAIVAYREQYGRFYSAEELTAVKGVGKSTVKKNLSRISIE